MQNIDTSPRYGVQQSSNSRLIVACLWFFGMPLLQQLVSSIYFLNLATTGLNPTAAFMAVLLLGWFSREILRATDRLPFFVITTLFAVSAGLAILLPAPPFMRIVLSAVSLLFLLIFLLHYKQAFDSASGLPLGISVYALYLAAGVTYRPSPAIDAMVVVPVLVGWVVLVLKSMQFAEAKVPAEATGTRASWLHAIVVGFWIFAFVQLFQFPGTAMAWTGLSLSWIAAIFFGAALVTLSGFSAWLRRVPAVVIYAAGALSVLDLAVWHRYPGAAFFVALVVLFEAAKALSSRRNGSPAIEYGVPPTMVMLLSFVWIFTITYDQARLLGSQHFRDQAPAILCLVGWIAMLPVFALSKTRQAGFTPLTFGLLMVAGICGIAIPLRTTPAVDAPAGSPLRVITYNIYQGYDPHGNENRYKLAAFFQNADAQLVGLEESDTTRPSSKNANIVEWLAKRLRYDSFFGPHPALGSYGVSMLSRLPILQTSVTALTSRGEQVHVVVTKHKWNGREFTFLVTHFGLSNEDHMFQTNETIRLVQSIQGPKILLGDFNLDPRDPFDENLLSRLIRETGLIDALAPDGYRDFHKWLKPTHEGGYRIDTLFVSSEFQVVGTNVTIDLDASDHYPVTADLQWR